MKAAQEDEGVDLAEEEVVEGAPLRSVTLGLQRCGVAESRVWLETLDPTV